MKFLPLERCLLYTYKKVSMKYACYLIGFTIPCNDQTKYALIILYELISRVFQYAFTSIKYTFYHLHRNKKIKMFSSSGR